MNRVLFYKFNIHEIRALYRLFEREWIPREDNEITIVTNRIIQIVRNNELVNINNAATRGTGES